MPPRGPRLVLGRQPRGVRRKTWGAAQGLGKARQPRQHEGLHNGPPGELGQYMVQHALDRGLSRWSACAGGERGETDAFKGRMTVIPGATDNSRGDQQSGRGLRRCSPCWPRSCPRYSMSDGSGGARPRVTGRALVFSCGGTSRETAGRLLVEAQVESTCPRGIAKLARWWTWTIRSKAAGAYSPAIRGGPSCAEATSKRATARACPCGSRRVGRPHPQEQHDAPRANFACSW